MEKNLQTICLGCGRINVNGEWIDGESFSDYSEIRRKIEDINMYCPECTEYFKKEYQKLKNQYSLLRN